MFILLKKLPARQVLAEQIPALAAAALIAERFYKFHSFLLECGAFIVTWFVLDGLLQFVKHLAGTWNDPPSARRRRFDDVHSVRNKGT